MFQEEVSELLDEEEEVALVKQDKEEEVMCTESKVVDIMELERCQCKSLSDLCSNATDPVISAFQYITEIQLLENI